MLLQQPADLSKLEELSTANFGPVFDEKPEVYGLLEKCKDAARSLKSKRRSIQSPPLYLQEYIPSRTISDRLVQLYLDTFETTFRVLHVPTFRQEYARYWSDPRAASENTVIKILLVVAIGTMFYVAEANEDTLHSQASLWINAAQSQLSGPVHKRYLSLERIQLHCLVLLALHTNTNAASGDALWISMDLTIRRAMAIGLHRDPRFLPSVSALDGEIRRRLWFTIIELALQSSLDSGMPFLMSANDYDCEPPLNLNDGDITALSEVLPASKPLTVFTDNSTQCALGRCLATRLEIVKILGGLQEELPYEKALQLGAELTSACRATSTLYRTFLSLSSSTEQARPNAFQIKFQDLLMRRFLLSLHTPFAHRASRNIAYYYSRKVCLESSLLVLSSLPELTGISTTDHYVNLRLFAHGIFKRIFMLASSTVCVEFLAELREDSSPPASVLPRNELYQTLRELVHVTKRRVQVGEPNVEAHVLFACTMARVDAVRANKPVREAVVQAAQMALESCRSILSTRLGNQSTSMGEGNGTRSYADVDVTSSPSTVSFYGLPANIERVDFAADRNRMMSLPLDEWIVSSSNPNFSV